MKQGLLIFLLFMGGLGGLCSCVSTPTNSISLMEEKQEVWKLLIKVLKSYPLKTIDKKAGYIETKLIKGSKIWKPPNKSYKDFYGYSYKIIAKLNYNPPLSTVTIEKKAYVQKGFLSEKKTVASNLLEEQVLLYEVSREVELKQLLGAEGGW